MYKDLIVVKDDIASIAGMKVTEIAKEFATPTICYNQEMLEANLELFKNNFISNKFDCQILYASKAFSVKAIYQLLNKYEIGADVVSSGELYTALKAGFDLTKVFFHGNNKSEEEIKMAIENNIGCLVIDNLNEVTLLKKLLENSNKKIEVMIRVNPGIDAHTHSYIQTAKLTSKFGISIFNSKMVAEFIKEIKLNKNLIFKGLHMHIGSQIFDDKAHIKAAKAIIDFMKVLKNEYQIECENLNLGGGFGISIHSQDKPFNIQVMLKELVDKVEKLLEKNNIQIKKLFIEPGRSLVSECAATLYTIGGKKDTYANKKYLFIDGGMHDNIRPALYQAKYECDVANKMNQEKSDVRTIAGKNCESGDILINDIPVQNAEIGDLLLVYSTGAYTYSMSSNYNRNSRPAVVFIKNGKAKLVVRRESLSDLINNDLNLED